MEEEEEEREEMQGYDSTLAETARKVKYLASDKVMYFMHRVGMVQMQKISYHIHCLLEVDRRTDSRKRKKYISIERYSYSTKRYYYNSA